MRHKSEWTEIRESLGLNQRELAAFLAISRSAMAMCETGVRKLDDTSKVNYVRGFVAKTQSKLSISNNYGLTKHEREDLSKRSIVLFAKLQTWKKQYKTKMEQAAATALAMQRISAMDFSTLGKDRKRLELWKVSQLADKDLMLYNLRQAILLKLEIKIKTTEAELACIEKGLALKHVSFKPKLTNRRL